MLLSYYCYKCFMAMILLTESFSLIYFLVIHSAIKHRNLVSGFRTQKYLNIFFVEIEIY